MSSISVSTSPLGVTTHQILVADDDVLSRQAMATLLEHENFSCIQVSSGPEALKAVEDADISAVVADINMVGNTRLELLNQLRQEAPHLSIILVTGHPSIETAAAATSLRAAAYLLKPVEPSQLVGIVRRECDQLALFRLLRERRQRLEEALQSMRALESAFAGMAGNAAATALQSYVALAFNQTIESLMDLRGVVATLSQQERSSELMSSSKPMILVNAIRETISVLEHTRTSFKSKELAALRKKLEDLLAQPAKRTSQPQQPVQHYPAQPGCSTSPIRMMMGQ